MLNNNLNKTVTLNLANLNIKTDQPNIKIEKKNNHNKTISSTDLQSKIRSIRRS